VVIDTSAVVAIPFEEDDHLRYARAIEDSSTRLVSAVTRVELSFVVEGRKGDASGWSASLH
jgi:ribonuclease VapC